MTLALVQNKYFQTANNRMADIPMENPTIALYDNYFAIIAYPEYVSCKIIAIPEKYDFKPYAYGFQKNSPYLPLFNHYLKEMKEKGSLKQIQDKFAPPPQFCPDVTGQPLGFESCFTAFLILIGGLVIGLMLLAIELCSKISGGNYHWLQTYDNLGKSWMKDEKAKKDWFH